MKQNKNGFTLAETIIGIGLLAVVLTGIMAFQIQLSKSSANETLASTLAVKRTELVGAITGDAAWQKTVASNAAAHLDCIGSTAGCTAFTGTYSFSVYDADNNTLFNPAVNTGFNRDGKPCTGTPCDAPFQIQWKAACGASDPNCAHPLIQITGTFATSTATASMDLKKYSFQINRSSLETAVCPPPSPACAGQLAVCLSSGWTCLPPNPPYCSGVASWIDAVTSAGPCSTPVAPATVLHNAFTGNIYSTIGPLTGPANFLCIPGQPNNGFIVQPGAVCGPAPTPAICGLANGTSPGTAPTLPADLCAAGTASAVAGSGPWTWSCAGSSTVSCATATAPNPTCAWIRVSDNGSALDTSKIVRSEIPRISVLQKLLGRAIPDAGACAMGCNTYSWLSS